MPSDKRDDDEIFKVDTVPPPEGDEDAYNAPTKIGRVSHDAWMTLVDENKAPPGGGSLGPAAQKPSASASDISTSPPPKAAGPDARPAPPLQRVSSEPPTFNSDPPDVALAPVAASGPPLAQRGASQKWGPLDIALVVGVVFAIAMVGWLILPHG